MAVCHISGANLCDSYEKKLKRKFHRKKMHKTCIDFFFSFFQPSVSKQQLNINGKHTRKSHRLWFGGFLFMFECVCFAV